jgi:hypothetical protein
LSCCVSLKLFIVPFVLQSSYHSGHHRLIDIFSTN